MPIRACLVHTCATLKLMLARLPLVLCWSAVSALAQSPCEGTPAYAPCEMPFDLSSAAGAARLNPYVNFTLQVEFRSPRFKTYLMPAFWDPSRNQMLVRFTPTEPGQWTYKVTSNVTSFDGKEGTFNAAASDAPGFVNVANVHHWATDNKKPHLWMGYIADRFSFVNAGEFEQLLNLAAQNKFTHFRKSIPGNEPDRPLVLMAADRPNP